MIRGLKESVRRGPAYFARRTGYKFYELTHPHDPWLSQGAVRFLDSALDGSGVGLEWGSGRSSEWFGRRLARLTSIEDNYEWCQKVRQRVDGLPVELRHVPLDAEDAKVIRHSPASPPSYVSVAEEFNDRSLDFALVDGAYRYACVKAVIPKLRPGALLVVDNTDREWLSDWDILGTWPVVHESRNVMTQTTIWRAGETL